MSELKCQNSKNYNLTVDADYEVIYPSKQMRIKGNKSEVEWRYDTPGECIDATVSIEAVNQSEKFDSLDRRVF